jgi:uncharacterized Zn finger protein
MTTSSDFTVSDINWATTQSRELSPNPAELIRTGVQSATILCKKCGNSWAERAGHSSSLRQAVGGYVVTCPACGTTGTASFHSG